MFGSSAKEIQEMMISLGELVVGDNSIRITNYPFQPSIAFDGNVISAQEMKDIDLESFPPTLHVGDELIFLTAEKKEELREFASRNRIRITRRPLIWEWILEPFLDTETTPELEAKADAILRSHGLNEEEVKSIRALVEKQMMKYNFDTMLWEWVQLGASDVLKAMRVKYGQEEFRFFYQRVMDIALRPLSQRNDHTI